MNREASEAPGPASVYIVTLNWNRCEDTLALLQSLQNLIYPDFHTVVIDNGSVDESVARIRQSFPDVIQLRNDQNLGFGRGFNRGIEYALEQGADYVFIINNDTTVDPQILTYLMKHASPNIGILSPLIYLAADPERIWSGGGCFSRFTLEVNLDLEHKLDHALPDIIERDFVTGCAMLFSADVLRKVGLFDEQFTMYYEDLDLCRRVRSAHYPIWLITGAKMWHKVAQSSGGKYTTNERYWMARSSVKYFSKHMRPANLPFVLLHRLGSAMKMSLTLTLKRQFPPLQAYWKGLIHGILDLRG